MTSIGEYAFAYCYSLTGITIPSSVTNIGDYAFKYCNSLYVVYNYSNLKFEIGSSDNGYIAYYAKILVNNDIVSYANDGYEYTLTDDNFLFRCKNNEYELIAYCGNQETVTLPTYINGNKYSIYKMRGVRNVIIPSSFISIGFYAFAYCDSLTGITIPSSVTSIGDYAFAYCDSLTSITIPSSITRIGWYAFVYCYSLTTVIFEENSKLTSIGYDAFAYCYSLTGITIPSSVTSIGNRAFYSCDSLISIIVDANNENYKSVDGNLYTKDGKTLIQYAIGKKDTSFIIPDGVTSIGDSAFSSCDSLTSITIPSSVTSIGSYAFRYCHNLDTIYYTGTESEWNAISININNSELTSATRYYYSETTPTEDGNYWHYVDGEIVVW